MSGALDGSRGPVFKAPAPNPPLGQSWLPSSVAAQVPLDGPDGRGDARSIRDQLGIVFCHVCALETMPLNTGCCGFCDTQIAAGVPKRLTLIEGGLCECGKSLPAGCRKFCSERCSNRAAYQKRKRRLAGETA